MPSETSHAFYEQLVKYGVLRHIGRDAANDLERIARKAGERFLVYRDGEDHTVFLGDIPVYAYEHVIEQRLRNMEPGISLELLSKHEDGRRSYLIVAGDYPSEAFPDWTWMDEASLGDLYDLMLGERFDHYVARVRDREASTMIPCLEEELRRIPEGEQLVRTRVEQRLARLRGTRRAFLEVQVKEEVRAIAERYPDLDIRYGYIGNITHLKDDRSLMVFIGPSAESAWGKFDPAEVERMLTAIRNGALEQHIAKLARPTQDAARGRRGLAR